MKKGTKPTPKRKCNPSKESSTIKTIKSKNPQHKADNLNKELKNVEYLLKVEEKNKKSVQQKFDKEATQIDIQREKLEDELDQALKDINEKEAQIFEIQKLHYDEFREEMEKYQLITEELKLKGVIIDDEVSAADSKQEQCLNIGNMLKEEYESYQSEVLLLKTIVKEKIAGLKELEASYPKEFRFLQEDFQLAKEFSELKQRNLLLNGQLKQAHRETEAKKVEMKLIEDQRSAVTEEHNVIEKEIAETGNDQSLTKIKEHIIKNIKDKYLWDTILFIIREFFSEKIFDVDCKFHERLYQQLITSLSAISKDFANAISKKEKERTVIVKRINEIRPSTQEEKQCYFADMTSLQKELEAMTATINALKQKYSKLEQLYNSILAIVQSKGYNCSDDLELQFKKEILAMILHENNFSAEERGNFEHLIQTFFTEMGIKERSLKSLRNKRNKVQNQLNQLTERIDQLKAVINDQANEIEQLTAEQSANSSNIQLISDTIIVRNKNLKANLEDLSDDQFRSYLKQNENALKNMKKIYGNKVLNKVHKVQKEKFMENVIIDHNEKKKQVHEDINFIAQYDKKLADYKRAMEKVEIEYHCALELFNQLGMTLERKRNEQKVIHSGIEELEGKIQTIMEDQVKETAEEKEKLKYKYNVNFYLNKIQDISSRIEKLAKQKASLTLRYNNYQKEYDEKTHKLHFEDLNIKNNIIAVEMGVDEDFVSTGNPFRHQDSDPNSPKSKRYSGHSINNDDEDLQKRLKDFNEIHPKLSPESLRSNSMEKLDYQKFLMNPEVNILKEKLRPLHNGLMIYKRFSSTSGFSKYNTFDLKKAERMPPENCGYAMRTFKLNKSNMSLDVYASSDMKRAEMRIDFRDIQKLIVDPSFREVIKTKEKMSLDLSQQLVLLSKNDFIQFTLALKTSIIDLIAPSYLTFTSFQTAVYEIINRKSSAFEESIRQIVFERKEEPEEQAEQGKGEECNN